jgi:hypothetical protein
MAKVLDLTGQRFGPLVAIRPLRRHSRRGVIWELKCDCGNVVIRPAGMLRYQHSTRPQSYCEKCRPRWQKLKRHFFKLHFELYGTLYNPRPEHFEPWTVQPQEPRPTALAPICPCCGTVTEDARILDWGPARCDFCHRRTAEAVACQECHSILCPSCNLAR